MARRALWCVLLFATVASAAPQRVTIPASGHRDVPIVLTQAQLKAEPVVWVQADPKQVEVVVYGPKGQRWTRADSSEGSPVLVRLADPASESEEELLLADLLGASTLIGWIPSAEPGTYRVQLIRKSGPRSIPIEQTTKRRLFQEKMLGTAFSLVKRRAPLDSRGHASLVLAPSAWNDESVVLIGTTIGREFRASLKLPDGTVVTEENAGEFGCEWSAESQELFNFEFLRTPSPQLWIACPEVLRRGTVTISVDIDTRGKRGEVAAAVVRFKLP